MRALHALRIEILRVAAVGVALTGGGVLVATSGASNSPTSTTDNATSAGRISASILTVDAPATHTCQYDDLVPGDLTGTSKCTFAVNYAGAMPGYVALSVAIRSKVGSGGVTLYDGTNSSGLSFSLSDGHRSFVIPSGQGTTGGRCPLSYRCWYSADELAAWYRTNSTNLTFPENQSSITWTLTPLFPRTAGNSYQGVSAAIILTANAVTSYPTALPADCNISTIGRTCQPTGSFTWK